MMISHLLSGGRVEEARQTAEQLIVARPNFTIDAWLQTQFRRDMARAEADPLPCAPPSFRWVERSSGRPGVETSFAAPRNVAMT
jgi:hypothetical protein